MVTNEHGRGIHTKRALDGESTASDGKKLGMRGGSSRPNIHSIRYERIVLT